MKRSVLPIVLLALCASLRTQNDPRPGIVFERNTGQFSAPAEFAARAPGYTLFLTPDGTMLSLRTGQGQGAALRMAFDRAAPDPAMRGEGEQPTRVHYLRGRDSRGWHTDNAGYARVRYEQLWPGVDAVFYERGGAVEFDFVVAPGADPASIGLRFEGLDGGAKPRVDDAGRLVLPTAAGDVVQTAPVLYQERHGERIDIDGRFDVTGDRVGFVVGDYAPELPLVIDPILLWATYFGGSMLDQIADVATDAQGNVYVTGTTHSADFPVTTGAFQTMKAGGEDAFVAKIAPNGDQLIWCTFLGGSSNPCCSQRDEGYAIDVDADGNVYVAGLTVADDFPTTTGAFDEARDSQLAGFVTKLAPNGDALIWSTLIEGNVTTQAESLAIGPDRSVYVAGFTRSSTFPTTPGAFQTRGATRYDGLAWVTRFAPDGASQIYSTTLGNYGEHGDDIAVDGAGRAYVTGHTLDRSFPTPNGAQTTHGGNFVDSYLARFSADGSTLDYGTFLGGSGNDYSATERHAVAVDGNGDAWIAGGTDSNDFPTTPGAFQQTHPGHTNGFVARIDTDVAGPAGLLWSTYLGGSNHDWVTNLAADSAGNVYVHGMTGSNNFPTLHAWQPCKNAGGDTFLSAFDASGALLWSTFFGGNSAENGGSGPRRGLALDPAGNLVIAGGTPSTDMATAGAFQPTNGGGNDGFVAKFSPQHSIASATVRLACTVPAPTGSLVPITPTPVLGRDFSVAIDDPQGQTGLDPQQTVTVWFISAFAAPGYPCGTPVLSFGELLLAAVPSPVFFLPQPWAGPGQPSIHTFRLPCAPTLHGAAAFTQGLFFDRTTVVLTDGLDLVLGT